MTNQEFSNEFDILYNNVTSNQAPGLDEYEKSVFLTKAQDQIIKDYFDPRSNKVQSGFDESQRRQIDFSMILKSTSYEASAPFEVVNNNKLTEGLTDCGTYEELVALFDKLGEITRNDLSYIRQYYDFVTVLEVGDVEQAFATILPFGVSSFDDRDNTKSVLLREPILMFINESLVVRRNGKETKLVVLPISYVEYTRLMSKPFKRPVKSQAWRLLDSSEGTKRVELIVGPSDSIIKYSFRYVRRPKPIVLANLDGLSIEGDDGSTQTPSSTSCELDPILHQEILQRAVELAKAAYTGDLTTQVALGQSSQTEIGMVASSK